MRGPHASKWLLCLGLVAAASLTSPDSSARAEAQAGYSKTQTYSGALRYLRVDLGYEITERDADAAYVLFRFVPSGKREPTNGSVEIVEAGEDVKVLVQIAQLPAYYETVLRDGLMRKLRDEYGEPVSKPKEEPPKNEGKDEPRDGPKEEPKDKAKDQPKDKTSKPASGSDR
jgi:hypothetical protein